MYSNPPATMTTTSSSGSTGGNSGGFLDSLLGPLLGIGSAAAGGAASISAYNKLEGVGEEAKREATQLANQMFPMSQFRPFTVTTATGGAFGARPTTTTITDPVTGEAREVVTGTEAAMTLSPEEQAMQGMLMGQSQQFFDQSASPMGQREADVYERIRAIQSPEEERQRLMLEERLANQGRLGVRTGMFGGTPEAFAMEKAQAEARNQAAMLAMQQAQAEQAQQQQLGLSALGGAYLPQAQLLNVQQAAQLYPQMQQQAQLYQTGQFGETMMTGIEAQLIAEQARANLLGGMGSNLLGGMFSPIGNSDDGFALPFLELLNIG